MNRRVALLALAALVAGCPAAEMSPPTDAGVDGASADAARVSPPPDPVFVEVTKLTSRPEVLPKIPEGVVDLSFLPDGSGQFFVGYRDGLIELRGADAQVVRSTEIPVRRGNECGLLTIEAHPEFSDNRRVFVGFCEVDAGITIQSLVWTATIGMSTQVADMTRTIDFQPAFNDFHNLSDMGFDEAHNLWFTKGDGNGRNSSQELDKLRGKLARITPRATGLEGYSIPADNPHVNEPGVRGEILAYGIKSAFRSHYAGDGRWFLADVGLDGWEEINVFTLTSTAWNLGYPRCEGNERLDDYERTGEPCDLESDASYLAPALVYEHDHTQSILQDDPEADMRAVAGWAVCGGVLYRGDRYDGKLSGRFIYSDISRGFVRSVAVDGDALTDDRHLGHLDEAWVWKIGPDGWIYVVARNVLYRLVNP